MDTEHESYGLISFGWGYGSAQPLFGSSIKHNSMIRVEVREATLRRELSHDWVHPGKILLIGSMSPNQFAELITHPNQGAGTPLTLEYVTGDDKTRREPPPFVEKGKEFTEEMSEHLDEVLRELTVLRDEQKTEKAKRKVEHIITQMRNNIPFVEQQFTKQMEQTVTEAKAEVETFISQRLREVGAAALTENMLPQLPESGQAK